MLTCPLTSPHTRPLNLWKNWYLVTWVNQMLHRKKKKRLNTSHWTQGIKSQLEGPSRPTKWCIEKNEWKNKSFTTVSSSMKLHSIDRVRTSCCAKSNLRLKFFEINMTVKTKCNRQNRMDTARIWMYCWVIHYMSILQSVYAPPDV